MTTNESEAPPKTLTILFFSAGGISFGVPVEQIKGTVECASCNDKRLGKLPWSVFPGVHDQISLIVNTPGEEELNVPVDALEEITSVGLDEVFPLPSIIESLLLTKGLWGGIFKNGRLFLLVDFAIISKQS